MPEGAGPLRSGLARLLCLVASSVLALGAIASLAAQSEAGRRAYADAGCAGCHGSRGQGGGDGPALVPMRSTFDEFAATFRQAMPNYDATDEQLELIYTFLRDLTESPPRSDPRRHRGTR